MIETPERASPLSDSDPHISSVEAILSVEDVLTLSSADFLPPSSGTRRRSWTTINEGRPARSASPVVDDESLALRDEIPTLKAPLRADPLLGMIVADRYRIVEAIGRGGMGIVYKVQHVRIGKLLAMKVLTGEMSQNAEVVRRFKREALAASKLQSPNTVQVFDFGVSEGLTYLVMELVSGESLGSALRTDGPMPFLRLGRIVSQVCSSLSEAHRKGVVHRDIKPENIMLVPVDGGGEVAKVLDFGLAKLREVEGAEDVTCRGVIMGTPSYMAPEQILGHEVDARTDVYGIGALMYRLATGHTPFRAPSQVAILEKHLHERPIPPAERRPDLDIPPGLDRIILRALRKDPDDRFQTIDELCAFLIEELRAAGATSVETYIDPSRLRRLIQAERVSDAGPLATRDEVDAYERRLRRRRYGAVVAVGALALSAAGAGASVVYAREARDARVTGIEAEPNDTPAEANPITLGQPVTGRLGKRIDATRGDRDFYAFELPAPAKASHPTGENGFLRLRLSALPSIATCAMIYRRGFSEPVGQYCTGRPGVDLVIGALALDPGSYLVAVLQDMDPRGGPPPYVYESISDTYTLLAESTVPDPNAETEPNDQAASATPVQAGRPVSASIGWAGDEDFFCVPRAEAAAVRWTVRASAHDGRALEATPMRGEDAGAAVRIHFGDVGGTAAGPWQSAPVAAGGAPRCLRVRMAPDADGAHAGMAYVVEAEPVR